MTKIKLFLIVLLIGSFVFAFAGFAWAAGFSDLQGHWAKDQIDKWLEKGLAGGYADGTFRPNGDITRAEFVALVNRAFNVQKISSGDEAGFSDIEPGKWYYDEVVAAKAHGYIGGYTDGTFKPDKTVTRQEVASILVRLLNLEPTGEGLSGYKDFDRMPEWSRANIGAVVNNGLMRGLPDNSFQPLKIITRAEAVVSLDRALNLKTQLKETVNSPVARVGTGIEGTILFNGQPAKNVIVRVFEADGYEVLKTIKTNKGGYYKVDLEPGKYDLTATTDREVGYKSDLEVAKDKIITANMELDEAAVVSGTLLDKDNKPVKNATVLFTTNPTFITVTGDKGEYTLPVLRDRSYEVRTYEPGIEQAEPVTVTTNLNVGSKINQNVGTLQASFKTGPTVVGGGGGGGGAPGAPEQPGDSGPTEPPVIESVTFYVNSIPVTLQGNDNVFTVDLSGYNENDKFTRITVKASEDAARAEIPLYGVSLDFQQGQASGTVSELLGVGGDGLSLKGLKNILDILKTDEILITVTGNTGLEAQVTVELLI